MKASLGSLILAFLFFSLSFSQDEKKLLIKTYNSGNQKATLGLVLIPGEEIGFDFFDIYSRRISFKNYSEKDSLITKNIFLEKPLHLKFRSIMVVPNGDPILRVYNLLLNPGDSVILKSADKILTMEYSSGFTNFIDSLITIPRDFGDQIAKQRKLLKEGGVSLVLNNIEATFKKNETTISSLNISKSQAAKLSDFNYNIKYLLIAHLLSEPTFINNTLKDSLYEAMLQDINHIQSINALEKSTIIGEIISYKIKKNNKYIQGYDFWSSLVESDQRIKQSDFYKPYLVSCIAGTFVYAPKDIKVINQKLKEIHTKDMFLDTLYQLTDILLNTYVDFEKSKEALKTFAGGRFVFIIDNNIRSSNHETKTVANLPAVILNDFAGRDFDFKKIIRNKNKKLTVVDFWASWCIPCIMEIPHWIEMKNKFKNKPVQFVSISIDKKQDVEKWISASKRHGIYKEPNQYIMEDFKNSPLTKLIGLRTIPRYIVVNSDGKILNEEFYRPNDNQFELELLKYLE